jgi:FkbM family methyltransferase
MNWKRAKFWFSRERLSACCRFFQNPYRAHLALAFLTHRPHQVTLKNGRSLAFSRARRDHLFWDWCLGQAEGSFDFTPEGELRLERSPHSLLLRPGTTDFFIFREIFLEDCYALKAQPERLGTVVDLGGNIGLFSCAVLPRADRVITVEAVEAHYQLARKNIVNSGGDPRNLVRFAVAGKSGGQAVIHRAERNAGASSIVPGFIPGTQVRETVSTISLEDLLHTMECPEVDFLKCDVEGAEFEIFLNAPVQVLRRIRRLVMEVHLNVDQAGTMEQALIGRLREAGMAVTLATPPTSRAVRNRMLTAHRPRPSLCAKRPIWG